MGIIHITGPKKSGKSLLANSMRNTHIGKSTRATDEEAGKVFGALVVDDTQEGEPRFLVEKLLDNESLGTVPGGGETTSRKADELRWKEDPMIIFVGDKIKLLDEFEELVPGLTKKLGPVRTLPME
jgi:hypothetical protein